MKRRIRHRRPCQIYRRNNRFRRQDAGSAHLHHNFLNDCFLDLRRVFERRRPAREFCRAAHTHAAVQIVELHHRAVNVIIQIVAAIVDGCNLRLGLLCRRAERVGNDLEMELSQVVQRLAVRLERHAVRQLQIEYQDIKRPLRRNFRVKLAERACRRVARIGKQRLACLFALLVETRKAAARHIHLTAYNQPRGRAVKAHRDRADGFQILRHVLAHKTVTARRAADKCAVNVFQCYRQSVNLGLDGVDRVRFTFTHTRVKLLKFFKGKHVLKALQRHSVAYLFKRAHRRAAHASGGAERRCILRVRRLQLLQTAQHPVIFIVLNLRVIQHIVLIAVIFQFLCQLLNLLSCVHSAFLPFVSFPRAAKLDIALRHCAHNDRLRHHQLRRDRHRLASRRCLHADVDRYV